MTIVPFGFSTAFERKRKQKNRPSRIMNQAVKYKYHKCLLEFDLVYLVSLVYLLKYHIYMACTPNGVLCLGASDGGDQEEEEGRKKGSLRWYDKNA